MHSKHLSSSQQAEPLVLALRSRGIECSLELCMALLLLLPCVAGLLQAEDAPGPLLTKLLSLPEASSFQARARGEHRMALLVESCELAQALHAPPFEHFRASLNSTYEHRKAASTVAVEII